MDLSSLSHLPHLSSSQVYDSLPDSVSTLPAYLAIQEQASQIIHIRPSFPHLSLNPLSGNSLY